MESTENLDRIQRIGVDSQPMRARRQLGRPNQRSQNTESLIKEYGLQQPEQSKSGIIHGEMYSCVYRAL